MKTRIISLSIDSAPSDDVATSIEVTPSSNVLALADGVGSYAGGGIAASIVIDGLEGEVKKSGIVRDWKNLFDMLQAKLQEAKTDKKLGTTLTAVSIANGQARIGHVGDCRLYHLRGGGIVTRTKDQTEVQYLLDRGVLNKFRAATYPRSNVLMSLLSPDRDYDLFESRFETEVGDRLILCSDGFYRALSKQRILEISQGARDFATFSNNVLEYLSASARTDDATCVLAELD